MAASVDGGGSVIRSVATWAGCRAVGAARCCSASVSGWDWSAVFVVGGLIARLIPPVRDYVTAVLEFANHGPLLLVVFITVVNGVAEELFFRGALYSALGGAVGVGIHGDLLRRRDGGGQPDAGLRRHPARRGMCAATPDDRRRVAPMLTHFCWGLVMVLGAAADLRGLAQRVGQLVVGHLRRGPTVRPISTGTTPATGRWPPSTPPSRQRSDDRERDGHEGQRHKRNQARYRQESIGRNPALQQRYPR